MKHYFQKILKLFVVMSGAYLLYACDSDSVAPPPPLQQPPPPAMASFDVTVSNLTNAQPLSPAAVIAHQDSYSFFAVGSPATAGLEEMAEGGDNAALIAEADADMGVTVTGSGVAAIGPASSETVTIDMLESDLPGLRISVATMLVNTNDAFTGLNAMSVEAMAVGDSVSIRGVAYDAGTEADSETAVTIPGPAGGGEGFNAARDDQADMVTMHAGVVSQDDGFATSDLSEQHRFDNPVVQIIVERTD